ncbi:MAG TPA: radical SAM protein, partial [Ktedonobacteraceae bacterium]
RWLVCNPLHSGMVAVLDEDAYALLRRFRRQHTLQAVLDDFSVPLTSATKVVALLTRAGFLLDLDQPPASSHRPSQETLAAWLHVTNACNLRCHYCYVSKSSEHMADDTSRRSVDAIIRSALSYHHSGIHLTYAGGEATLRLPQVITLHDYALQQCQQHGLTLSASLLTNGVAMPHRFIEQLKQRHIRVGLSLDGIAESHDVQRPLLTGQGSFSLVDRTISRLLAADLVPSINVTVTQLNLDALPRLLAYLLQRDLPFGLSYYRDNECSSHLADLQFSEARMISGMRHAFAYIEDHLPRRPLLGLLVDKASTQSPRQYTCGVGRNYLAIDQRGGIARCHADITDTITTIEEENPLRVIRAERRGVQAVAVEDKAGCRSCEWRFWCTGGCPMLTYRLTGRSDIRSPNCAIYKALFPEALRLEALRLLKYESPITL